MPRSIINDIRAASFSLSLENVFGNFAIDPQSWRQLCVICHYQALAGLFSKASKISRVEKYLVDVDEHFMIFAG